VIRLTIKLNLFLLSIFNSLYLNLFLKTANHLQPFKKCIESTGDQKRNNNNEESVLSNVLNEDLNDSQRNSVFETIGLLT
jgi:hypothetical protein